jgi:hypothetical protein
MLPATGVLFDILSNMNIRAMISSLAAASCVLSSAVACPSDTTFECPDDRALHLLDLAVRPHDPQNGFNDSKTAFSFVIENSTRQMDEVPLRIACSRLAYELYMDDYVEPGADVFGLIPPKEVVGQLRKNHPILSRCPYHSLYAAQLPGRVPPPYVPPEDAVRHGITGWVDLELDVSDDGKVETARIVDSSNSLLEPGIVDYVFKFRYPKKSHYNGQFMKRKGFQVRLITDYFQLARAAGCEWEDPRGNWSPAPP